MFLFRFSKQARLSKLDQLSLESSSDDFDAVAFNPDPILDYSSFSSGDKKEAFNFFHNKIESLRSRKEFTDEEIDQLKPTYAPFGFFQVGFQREDPTTDFRALGALAPCMLLHVIDKVELTRCVERGENSYQYALAQLHSIRHVQKSLSERSHQKIYFKAMKKYGYKPEVCEKVFVELVGVLMQKLKECWSDDLNMLDFERIFKMVLKEFEKTKKKINFTD